MKSNLNPIWNHWKKQEKKRRICKKILIDKNIHSMGTWICPLVHSFFPSKAGKKVLLIHFFHFFLSAPLHVVGGFAQRSRKAKPTTPRCGACFTALPGQSPGDRAEGKKKRKKWRKGYNFLWTENIWKCIILFVFLGCQEKSSTQEKSPKNKWTHFFCFLLFFKKKKGIGQHFPLPKEKISSFVLLRVHCNCFWNSQKKKISFHFLWILSLLPQVKCCFCKSLCCFFFFFCTAAKQYFVVVEGQSADRLHFFSIEKLNILFRNPFYKCIL